MRKCHGSHVVFAFVHICNVVKTTDFECVTIDDRKEGGKDVDGNNNVDQELPKWIRIVSPSGNEEKTKIFQAMEDNEEPELSLLIVPVDLPAGEEGEGEPEGGDEVHQPLPHHASAKLGRAQESVAGHQHQVDQDKGDEQNRILSYFGCDGIKALAEVLLEFNSEATIIQFGGGINTMIASKPLIDDWDEDGGGDGEHPD